jgi:hypothetical protein
MVIQGCGGAVTLRGVGEKFAEGLVVLTGAAGVTLRGITLIPQGTIVKPDLFNSLMVRLEFALPQAGDAIRVLQEVLKDRFAMSPPRQPVHLRMNDWHRLRCSNHSFAKSVILGEIPTFSTISVEPGRSFSVPQRPLCCHRDRAPLF